MCFVGNWDRDALLWFVIVPLACYLAIGTVALLAGFASLFKVQRAIKDHSVKKKTKKHKKLIIKIGIFSLLYTIPAFSVIVINVHQYKYHAAWRTRAENTWCQLGTSDNSYDNSYGNGMYRGRPYSYYAAYAPSNAMRADLRRGYYRYRPHAYPPGRGYYKQPMASGGYRYNENKDTSRPNYEYSDKDYGNFRHPDKIFTGKSLYKLSEDQQYGFESYDDYYMPDDDSYEGDEDSFYSEQYRDPYVPPQTSQRHVDCKLDKSIPRFCIFAVKIFMSLIAGIATGIWIWSGKTYQSWKEFLTCRYVLLKFLFTISVYRPN